jgi:beta-galactosidase
MHLGVCYYPEQWDEARWQDDAKQMAALGLTRVRIGEFAWSRIEPSPGIFDWGWLDRVMDTLHAAGLGVILGTPTATPPKWLIDAHPDILALDIAGRPRRFGARRHYCFSSRTYRKESARIVTAVVARYAAHPAIVMWQTDNEYGCHNTTLSYSAEAAAAFRVWLAARYGNITSLNAAWGTVFWSQEYRSFDEIDLPNLTVTEANPSHWLAYRRFASDEVISFNRIQTDIIRTHAPGVPVTHNMMGFVTDFDHHALGADLDSATWDSYPLGFLESFWFTEAEKITYARQGHPDIAAFHHDLYRGCSKGRWGVMEQQPGPVNWAAYNPAPLPGMVRLWTLEAFAHGAELVSYFRWRQAPFAQEQMHTGLHRPDGSPDVACAEIVQACADLKRIPAPGDVISPVALVFGYDAQWLLQTQPQGASFDYVQLAFAFYSALRQLGLDVDIVAPGAALEKYSMVVVPSLPVMSDDLLAKLSAFNGPVLLGPRTGSKTSECQISPGLPPGPVQKLVPIKVVRVESLRPGLQMPGDGFAIHRWFEHVESDASAEISLQDSRGICFKTQNYRYLAGWPDAALLQRVLGKMAAEAGLVVMPLPEGVRVRRRGALSCFFNYGQTPVSVAKYVADDEVIVGDVVIEAAGVTMTRSITGVVRPEKLEMSA